ncbi:sulfatase [bacterium]|jgi:N-sulfoglucosamine sulfohydrolase|nr:sulfatase [bacterium]
MFSTLNSIRFLCLTLLLTLVVSCLSRSEAAEKPNFVFIIADDCTFRDIGCYGGQAKTPNIDKLATEGMRFTHCFQTAPMCSPTRHNIYTGQYPVQTGAYPNHTQTYRNIKNITHYLPELGYRVALSGKKHIGPQDLFQFEYSGKNNNPDEQVIDELFADSAKTKTPFCLFACSNEPHSPWNKGDASVYPPASVQLPPYIADTPVVRDLFSKYLAEVTYYDQQVGNILKLLKDHKLEDNTLVIVVSEQGNSFPFAKWTCYDSGLQSAMIVRWPSKVKSNSVSAAMVDYSDVTPTFVEAAGGVPAQGIQGKSLLPVLFQKTDQHKEFVYGVMTTKGIINGTDAYPIRSIRSRDYKLILNLNHEATFTNACTKSKEFQSMVAAAEAGDEQAKRLVDKYMHRPRLEYYDVQKDPMELTNLAGRKVYASEIKKLEEQLHAWMKSQGDEGMETELAANSHIQRKKKQRKK